MDIYFLLGVYEVTLRRRLEAGVSTNENVAQGSGVFVTLD